MSSCGGSAGVLYQRCELGPTDITLLWDAMRKIITLIARLSEDCGLST